MLVAPGCAGSGDRSAAKVQYEQALAINQSGRGDQAIAALERATRADPSFKPAQSMLADLYKDRGEYAKAGQHYEALTKLEPKVAKHYSDLGLMQQMLGKLQEAVASYLKALKLQPKDPDTNMNLGLVYLNSGDVQQSVKYLHNATVFAPESILAWTNYAVGLEGASDLHAAENAYKKALELPGDKAPVLINYGGNLIQQKRANDAVAILQEAIRMNDSALLNKLMGDALALKGWPDAAIGRYQRAIKIDPTYVKAYNALGDALIAAYEKGLELQESQRDAALAAWKQSLVKKPDQPEIEKKIEQWKR
jgi:tetratricopeptide (TPR) repeat protein